MPRSRQPVIGRPQVALGLPRRPLFVGSYHRVSVKIPKGAGIAFDDLTFDVPDGPKAGIVSQSRDALFNPARPHFMLCAGFEPGTYVVEARVAATNQLVGQRKFVVDALWTIEDLGPTRWFTGIVGSYAAGSAWGGGPAGPQNVNVVPATGTRRIAILLVDTSTQRYTTNATDLQGHRDRWTNELVNGVTQGGVTRSARLFYREASYNNFDLSAQVFGPVQLPGTWDDYFNSDGTPKGTYFQACFTAGDGTINYNNFDTLLCVSQSVAGPPMSLPGPMPRSGTGVHTRRRRAARTTASSPCPTNGERPVTARSTRPSHTSSGTTSDSATSTRPPCREETLVAGR